MQLRTCHSQPQMVRPTRFELVTFGFGGQRSIHLSYGRERSENGEATSDFFGGVSRRNLARPEGLEPPTYGFEARRSIQLSYGRTIAKDITAIRDGADAERRRRARILASREKAGRAAFRPEGRGRTSRSAPPCVESGFETHFKFKEADSAQNTDPRQSGRRSSGPG